MERKMAENVRATLNELGASADVRARAEHLLEVLTTRFHDAEDLAMLERALALAEREGFLRRDGATYVVMGDLFDQPHPWNFALKKDNILILMTSATLALVFYGTIQKPKETAPSRTTGTKHSTSRTPSIRKNWPHYDVR